MLSNVLGLVVPATINLALVLVWRKHSASCVVPQPVGGDVLWVNAGADSMVCLQGGWRWIVASSGRLVATLALLVSPLPCLASTHVARRQTVAAIV